MATVFHLDPHRTVLPDGDLAALLQDVARDGANAGERVGARVPGALASAVSGVDGVALGSIDVGGMDRAARAEAAGVLAAGVAKAEQDGHPAAERLAGVAQQWQEFMVLP